LWPAEDVGAALLEVLQQAEEEEPDPERRSRLAAVRSALGGLAKDVLTDVASRFIQHAAGM